MSSFKTKVEFKEVPNIKMELSITGDQRLVVELHKVLLREYSRDDSIIRMISLVENKTVERELKPGDEL